MILSPAFRSANSVRITVPRAVRQALQLLPGHRVLFTIDSPGIVTIQNADVIMGAGMQVITRK